MRRINKKYKILYQISLQILLIVFLYTLNGCATLAVQETLKGYNEPEREFIKKTEIYDGVYTGTIKKKGKMLKDEIGYQTYDSTVGYFCFHFQNCLKGKNRHIDISVPNPVNQSVILNENVSIEETPPRNMEGEKAILYVMDKKTEFLKKEEIYNVLKYRRLPEGESYPVIIQIKPGFPFGTELAYMYKGEIYDLWVGKVSLNRNAREGYKTLIKIGKYTSPIITAPIDIVLLPFLLASYVYSFFHGW